MKRLALILVMAAAVLATMPSCQDVDETTGPNDDNVTGTPAIPDSLGLARAFGPLHANGVDQLTIFATVVDSKGVGISDLIVHFSTTAGTIEPLARTGADGMTSVELTSGASVTDMTATVAARVTFDSSSMMGAAVVLTRFAPGPETIKQALAARSTSDPSSGIRSLAAPPSGSSVHDEIPVTMLGVTLVVGASPATIPADGISDSQVTAHLFETTSRIPLEAEQIRFSTTAGSITGTVETDPTGIATALLGAATSDSEAQIVAFHGNTLTDTTQVAFTPLTLSVQSAAAALRADGIMQTPVTARLLTAEHNPVVGARIDFATTLGTITSPVTTNAGGEAIATLTAGTTAGTTQITARFAGALAASDDVVFSPMPTTQRLLVSVDPMVLPADGASEAVITATALDANGDPMPDGTFVTFAIASGGGEIVSPNAATVDGNAQATYVAGRIPEAVSITATSGTAQGSAPIILQPLLPGTISLTTQNPTVLADGVASTLILAVVRDAFGNPVAAGSTVRFTASLGLLTDVMPTDAAGTASARLRAERGLTGVSRVTAVIGSNQQTIDVRFVSENAAHIVAVAADHPHIGILGAGDVETATLTFRVDDRNAIPVDSDHSVQLAFTIVPTGGTPDATCHPAVAMTNEHGIAVATVNAGIIAGAVEVRAASGTMVSQPIPIAIHGDLPDEDHFSIRCEPDSIADYYGERIKVIALVGDAYGNPVPDSTAVYFDSTGGVIQGSAFTSDHGEATVDLVVGDPYPTDGLALVRAQTVSKSGELIYAQCYVMWP